MCLFKILRSGGFVWEVSVDDVYELSAQVSFHVSIPWGIVPNDFSFAISVACWLWVVCKVQRKIIFTACPSGKLNLAFTSPDVISTSAKNVLFLCYSNSS